MDYLREQEASESDAAQRFDIREQIAEAKTKIAELESSPDKRPTENLFKADISRIVDYAPAELIGRAAETGFLNDAWERVAAGKKGRPHVLTFVALGGEGKTSLVAKWIAELAAQDWPGCDAAFAWSFYSQGTSEETQASSDPFLREALIFFGDKDTANSAKQPTDKARKLAQLIDQRRTLLVLDGLEPLQYAPTSPTGSELKDQGMSALLTALATNSRGLCLITTRYPIPNLRNFRQSTAPEIELTSLSNEAGVALLRSLEIKGTKKEIEHLVTDVRGHALTLNLLGSFLRDAHAGDIRKRDLVRLEEADAEEQSGHAFHVMDAYVDSFRDEGEKGRRALSVLRLLGLFDRPATAECLNALWTTDEIEGLTGSLIGLSKAQRNIVLKRLEDARLITVNRESGSEELVSIYAHPLLREYFAVRVRTQFPAAWRAAHRRLYEYLRDHTQEGDEPTLEDLQPLYQAVAHGCKAGMYEQAGLEVYRKRIHRREEIYALHKLGAFGTELGAVASFFEKPWVELAGGLSLEGQGWLLNHAAYGLRAVGRLNEALEPMRAGMEVFVKLNDWTSAAASASNLSELEQILGDITKAVTDAEQSVTYADRSGDRFEREADRGRLADALHQAGRQNEALDLFRTVEAMQAQSQPEYPLCYSLRGFRYCDLLLAASERAAWQVMLVGIASPDQSRDASSNCQRVSERAALTLHWSETVFKLGLLSIALDQLTLGCAALYAAVLTSSELESAKSRLMKAVDGLRRAGQQQYFPPGLLARAWLRFLAGARFGPESAQEDIDEAWEIAERGPMRLHMADIHLFRARLFHAVKPYPWHKFANGSQRRGPLDDLKEARKLIEDCGYWRRKDELEDAEKAAQNWD